MSMLPLQSSKPTKFVDVKPGSTIEVSDVQNSYEPFEAVVLEMRPEHGPNRIPALIIKADHNPEPMIIGATGKTRVKVLLDSSNLASATLPPAARKARSIPIEVDALQFTGGVISATEVIRFCAGRVNVRYQGGDSNVREALIIVRGGREDALNVGDWALRSEKDVVPVSPDKFASGYEVI